MPEAERRPLSRVRTVATGRRPAGVARTAEPRERPQWQGLFREPDLPPYDEEEPDV
jgi:hypothetical protein